jgi:hypothetical protein
MFPECFSIEHKLKECIHLDGILRQYQAPVIFQCQLLQAEESEIPEYLIQHIVIPVRGGRETFEEDCVEDLKELLIADTTIEYLFDENLLIGVLVL